MWPGKTPCPHSDSPSDSGKPPTLLSTTQEAVQEAAAVHCGHSEELQGFLLEAEVPAPPLGGAHLPEASAGTARPPGLQPAAGGEEEEGGGEAPQEDGGRVGEVGSSGLCS